MQEERQEIVHFIDEGIIPASDALPDLSSLDEGYLNTSSKEGRDHSIIDFLSRPIIIQQGVWSTTNARASVLYTANFPEVLISNVMYQEKLKGFVGLRATLCIRVQVNSQPFQQGRLMLQYFPYAQYMANRVTMVNHSLQGLSGSPRTDLDLSVATECDLCIPYVSPHLYYNLITGQGSFGAIYLVVYSPLLDTASSGQLDYTIWAHLENIDLQYPTGASIFTGSAPNKFDLIDKLSSAINLTQVKNIISKVGDIFDPSTIFAQSELEFLNDHAAPSAGFGQIASGLNTLSYIPIIGNLFTKPAWITAKIGNMLRMFGFSKPTIAGTVMEMRSRYGPRMANFDGPDASHKLSLASDNSIETVPALGGTNVDEMAISTIVSIPNYWDNFTWTGATTAGAVLYSIDVTPFLIKPFSSTITDRFLTTHLGYVAQCFGLWRGSIVYTFKFVKTKFHSGRCRISFTPFRFSEQDTEVIDFNKSYQIIVDLRTATEVSFTVPYVSSRPWMFVGSPTNSNFSDLYWNLSTGVVKLQVLNELRSVSSVSPNIDVIVEINAGPDMCFACPSFPQYVPSNYTPAALKASESKPLKPKILQIQPDVSKVVVTPPVDDDPHLDFHIPPQECVSGTHVVFHDDKGNTTQLCDGREVGYRITPQGVGVNESIPRNESQMGRFPNLIDGNKISSNWSPEAYCVGEKIFSIRQLLKRFCRYSLVQSSSAASRVLVWFPWLSRRPVQNTTTNTSWGYYDYFFYIYAFYRGGMRLKIAVTNSTSTTGLFSAGNSVPIVVQMFNALSEDYHMIMERVKTSLSNLPLITIPGIRNHSPACIVTSPSMEGMVEIEVPYYNVSHITQCSFQNVAPRAAESLVLRGTEPLPLVTINNVLPSNITTADGPIYRTNWDTFRAVADDFSFFYLTGVPILNAIITAPIE